MQPPYNMADPHRMYSNSPYPSNSPYAQQIVYVPSNPNSSSGPPSQYGYQPHQQGPPHAGSLGLQSPMIGQIGLGTPPMMSGMSSPIGAFYGGGGAPLPGGFGGIGSTRDTHFQQSQQQNNGDGYRSSPSNYFMTSPPGGRIAPLGPAPSFGGGFGSFPPSNSTNSFLPPNVPREEHLSHAGSAGGTGSIGGTSSILNGSNGFNAYGAPRSNGSRSATPQEVRRSTPLGNGSSFAPTSPLHSSSTTNGTYNETKRDISGVMLGFEGLSIES